MGPGPIASYRSREWIFNRAESKRKFPKLHCRFLSSAAAWRVAMAVGDEGIQFFVRAPPESGRNTLFQRRTANEQTMRLCGSGGCDELQQRCSETNLVNVARQGHIGACEGHVPLKFKSNGLPSIDGYRCLDWRDCSQVVGEFTA